MSDPLHDMMPEGGAPKMRQRGLASVPGRVVRWWKGAPLRNTAIILLLLSPLTFMQPVNRLVVGLLVQVGILGGSYGQDITREATKQLFDEIMRNAGLPMNDDDLETLQSKLRAEVQDDRDSSKRRRTDANLKAFISFLERNFLEVDSALSAKARQDPEGFRALIKEAGGYLEGSLDYGMDVIHPVEYALEHALRADASAPLDDDDLQTLRAKLNQLILYDKQDTERFGRKSHGEIIGFVKFLDGNFSDNRTELFTKARQDPEGFRSLIGEIKEILKDTPEDDLWEVHRALAIISRELARQ